MKQISMKINSIIIFKVKEEHQEILVHMDPQEYLELLDHQVQLENL